jgi:hypothetical protein
LRHLTRRSAALLVLGIGACWWSAAPPPATPATAESLVGVARRFAAAVAAGDSTRLRALTTAAEGHSVAELAAAFRAEARLTDSLHLREVPRWDPLMGRARAEFILDRPRCVGARPGQDYFYVLYRRVQGAWLIAEVGSPLC